MPDDSTTAGGEPVFRLIYRSRLTIPAENFKEEVANILKAARRKNPTHGITGALVIWEDGVVQTLEGDEGIVRGLYETIQGDSRHSDVELVEESPGVERTFVRWSMAQVSDGNEADIPIDSNQWEGAVDVRGFKLVTPEEDKVISSMRDRVRGART
jgi:hypothetical protein